MIISGFPIWDCELRGQATVCSPRNLTFYLATSLFSSWSSRPLW
jgi:hypothetical protein